MSLVLFVEEEPIPVAAEGRPAPFLDDHPPLGTVRLHDTDALGRRHEGDAVFAGADTGE